MSDYPFPNGPTGDEYQLQLAEWRRAHFARLGEEAAAYFDKVWGLVPPEAEATERRICVN